MFGCIKILDCINMLQSHLVFPQDIVKLFLHETLGPKRGLSFLLPSVNTAAVALYLCLMDLSSYIMDNTFFE